MTYDNLGQQYIGQASSVTNLQMWAKNLNLLETYLTQLAEHQCHSQKPVQFTKWNDLGVINEILFGIQMWRLWRCLKQKFSNRPEPLPYVVLHQKYINFVGMRIFINKYIHKHSSSSFGSTAAAASLWQQQQKALIHLFSHFLTLITNSWELYRQKMHKIRIWAQKQNVKSQTWGQWPQTSFPSSGHILNGNVCVVCTVSYRNHRKDWWVSHEELAVSINSFARKCSLL